jgi:hypothetical protein
LAHIHSDNLHPRFKFLEDCCKWISFQCADGFGRRKIASPTLNFQ